MNGITDLFHSLLFDVWSIAPSHIGAMVSTWVPTLTAPGWPEIRQAASERPKTNIFTGEALPQMEMRDDCSVIPVKGRIMKDVPDIFKSILSVCDIRDVQSEIQQSLGNPECGRIAFDIESPGGMSAAGDELAADIEAACRIKPCMAYARNLICSAAYEIAAPCQMIMANEHAQVGNIGSLYIISNYPLGEMEKAGNSVDVFVSGLFKSIGYSALSQEQKDWLESVAADYGERFRDFVRRGRPNVKEEDMQGQWFRGEDAALRGLTAGTAKNLNSALASFRRLV